MEAHSPLGGDVQQGEIAYDSHPAFTVTPATRRATSRAASRAIGRTSLVGEPRGELTTSARAPPAPTPAAARAGVVDRLGAGRRCFARRLARAGRILATRRCESRSRRRESPRAAARGTRRSTIHLDAEAARPSVAGIALEIDCGRRREGIAACRRARADAVLVGLPAATSGEGHGPTVSRASAASPSVARPPGHTDRDGARESAPALARRRHAIDEHRRGALNRRSSNAAAALRPPHARGGRGSLARRPRHPGRGGLLGHAGMSAARRRCRRAGRGSAPARRGWATRRRRGRGSPSSRATLGAAARRVQRATRTAGPAAACRPTSRAGPVHSASARSTYPFGRLSTMRRCAPRSRPRYFSTRRAARRARSRPRARRGRLAHGGERLAGEVTPCAA